MNSVLFLLGVILLVGHAAKGTESFRARNHSAHSQHKADPGCRAKTDMKLWAKHRVHFVHDMKSCGIGCMGDSDCTARCLHRREGYSASCVACMGALADCVLENCLDYCMADEDHECKHCTVSHCDRPFAQCSGIPYAQVRHPKQVSPPKAQSLPSKPSGKPSGKPSSKPSGKDQQNSPTAEQSRAEGSGKGGTEPEGLPSVQITHLPQATEVKRLPPPPPPPLPLPPAERLDAQHVTPDAEVLKVGHTYGGSDESSTASKATQTVVTSSKASNAKSKERWWDNPAIVMILFGVVTTIASCIALLYWRQQNAEVAAEPQYQPVSNADIDETSPHVVSADDPWDVAD